MILFINKANFSSFFFSSNWLTRSCLMASLFPTNYSLSADEEFLRQAVTSPTRYRTGHLPSTLELVFSNYNSNIQSINHLAPLGKSDHATITAFKIFTGLLDIDPNLFFLPPARSDLRDHSYKVLQGADHRRRRGSAFSMKFVKY